MLRVPLILAPRQMPSVNKRYQDITYGKGYALGMRVRRRIAALLADGRTRGIE
jgi:hypothetical protein